MAFPEGFSRLITRLRRALAIATMPEDELTVLFDTPEEGGNGGNTGGNTGGTTGGTTGGNTNSQGHVGGPTLGKRAILYLVWVDLFEDIFEVFLRCVTLYYF